MVQNVPNRSSYYLERYRLCSGSLKRQEGVKARSANLLALEKKVKGIEQEGQCQKNSCTAFT